MEVRRYSHRAMHTGWDLFLCGGNPEDSDDAARSVFREIDVLESELSRFRADSDIGRLNRLPAGETTRVGAAAMDCLLLAKDVHAATFGAFDITIGPLMECWSTPDGVPRRATRDEIREAAARVGMRHLILEPDVLRAGTLVDGLVVDLGGIGKGYALDQAAEHLEGMHGFGNFLLNAGDSTVLARGPGPDGSGWPVLAGAGGKPVYLRGESMSGSGSAVKGEHVMDPRTSRPVRITRGNPLWVRAALASVSDAFSTAFLVLSAAEVRDVCAAHPEIQRISR